MKLVMMQLVGFFGVASAAYGYGGNDGTCANLTCATDPTQSGQDFPPCVCGPWYDVKAPDPIKGYKRPRYGGYGDSGLCKETYDGYWCEQESFFKDNDAHNCTVEEPVQASVPNNIMERTNGVEVKGPGPPPIVVDPTIGPKSFRWKGYFHVKKMGKYKFGCDAKGGSCVVQLGGSNKRLTNVVENRKIQGRNPNNGNLPFVCDGNKIYLKKGTYKIKVFWGAANLVPPIKSPVDWEMLLKVFGPDTGNNGDGNLFDTESGNGWSFSPEKDCETCGSKGYGSYGSSRNNGYGSKDYGSSRNSGYGSKDYGSSRNNGYGSKDYGSSSKNSYGSHGYGN